MRHGYHLGRLYQAAIAGLILAGSGPVHADSPLGPSQTVAADHAARMARGLDLFKNSVRGILVQKCLKCHGGKSIESDFDLSDRDKLLRGGMTGPALVVGDSKASLLVQLIHHDKKPYMPHQGRPLAADDIKRIASWIDCGAPYAQPLIDGKAETSWTRKTVPATARAFWSFQPLRRQEPAPVKNESWARTPIDQFILAKLEKAGIKPNPPVDRRQLIRRAYFDLIGLPPAPEEVAAFVQDSSANAYEHLIERLLASPHLGERWGRHWLDMARFAESHGFEHDYDRPTAYPYRDFVIQAFNQDLPFNTFVRWQLAGDEFAPDNPLALAATGYLAAGVHATQITKNEVAKQRYDEMDDMIATTGPAMLGLTIGCARCHDHKFDPIPQADYYRLLATFTTTVRTEVDIDVDPKGYRKAKVAFEQEHLPFVVQVRRYEAEHVAQQATRREAWLANPDRWRAVLVDALGRKGISLTGLTWWTQTTDPEWRRLKGLEWEHLGKAPKPRLRKTLISSEGLPALRLHTQGGDFLPETDFLRRGDPDQPEGAAPQSFLQVLMTAPERERHWQAPAPSGCRTSYRRRALAQWLTDVDVGAGQLLARVIVNRLWQHHMGRGIVSTPNEFGTRGEPPTHPELLDWLATELIRGGWRLKPIHRLIMTSSVYQQSDRIDDARARLDRDNLLWWRRPRRRLEAEIIRDAMLAVSGTLDSTLLGPGTLEETSRRRSIYFTVKRSGLVPMMQVFDWPDALQGIGERPTTTVAPQALLLMNNPNVRGWARELARRAGGDSQRAWEEAITSSYQIALNRNPSSQERALARSFVTQQEEMYHQAGNPQARANALTDFCQALLCLNEFVYVD